MPLSIGAGLDLGVPGSADSSGLTLAITKGALVVGGKNVGRDNVYFLQRGGPLTISGKTLAVGSSASQFVTVTTLASIGVYRTLFDALVGITPEVGDIWRVPLLSSDGGTVVVYGDGSFDVSSPSAGLDMLLAVMYYDASADTWYGPTDFSILNLPLALAVTRGSLGLAGKVVTRDVAIDHPIAKGSLTVIGRQAFVTRAYDVLAGHLVIESQDIGKLRNLFITKTTLTIEGLSIDQPLGQLTLTIDKGALVIEGATDLGLDREIAIDKGALAVVGLDVQVGEGFPLLELVIDATHLSIPGRDLRVDRELPVIAGHMVVHGKQTSVKVARRIPLSGVIRKIISIKGVLRR